MGIDIIDNKLTLINEEIQNFAELLVFKEVCVFSSEDDYLSIPHDQLNISGVYLIHVKTYQNLSLKEWIEKFHEDWRECQGEYTPSVKLKRIKATSTLNEWMPIYIGKSKNIRTRIDSHIHLQLKKKTFSLKLKARKKMVSYKFKLSVIELPVKNYDSIVPVVESVLRDKYNPLIGKQ